MVTTVVSWNIAKRREPWRHLVEMGADVALLQEAGKVPTDVADRVDTGPVDHWDSHVWNSGWYRDRFHKLFDRWPMVVKLSDRVEVEWFKQVSPISITLDDEIAVSGIGTIAAGRVIPQEGSPFIAVSMYARWIRPHPSTRSRWRVGYPDGSAHRIISDLSAFVGSTDPNTHRILAAGDLNMSFSPGGNDPFDPREHTVVDRMDVLGFELIGPRYPAGKKADPAPEWLPPDTPNVPTYHTTRQSPATAQNQLDWAFASRGFHQNVTVRALNTVEDWGPSDHCRLLIKIAPDKPTQPSQLP